MAIECENWRDYIQWFEGIKRWEETKTVPADFCPLCFPPKGAGPDILVAYYFSMDQKASILHVQVKLQKRVNLSHTIKTVDPDQMFKTKGENLKGYDEFQEIYQDRGWYDHTWPVVVLYPLEVEKNAKLKNKMLLIHPAGNQKFHGLLLIARMLEA